MAAVDKAVKTATKTAAFSVKVLKLLLYSPWISTKKLSNCLDSLFTPMNADTGLWLICKARGFIPITRDRPEMVQKALTVRKSKRKAWKDNILEDLLQPINFSGQINAWPGCFSTSHFKHCKCQSNFKLCEIAMAKSPENFYGDLDSPCTQK